MKTQKQREEEANAWNNWKPGSGQQGWSPFDKPIPPVRDTLNRPLKDGQIDIARWVDEVNKGIWKPK